MIYPVDAYNNLIAAIIYLLFSIATAFKVYNNSKSQFSYTLLLFTFANGLINFAWFLILAYPITVQEGGKTI
jgi:tryptophan-rich sensory protein